MTTATPITNPREKIATKPRGRLLNATDAEQLRRELKQIGLWLECPNCGAELAEFDRPNGANHRGRSRFECGSTNPTPHGVYHVSQECRDRRVEQEAREMARG